MCEVAGCGSCRSGFHARLVDWSEVLGESELQDRIDSVAADAVTEGDLDELLGCIGFERDGFSRAALFYVYVAARLDHWPARDIGDTVGNEVVVELIRLDLLAVEPAAVAAAAEAAVHFGDGSLREEMIVGLEANLDDHVIVDRALSSLTFWSDDFDPEVDDLMLRAAALGGDSEYETVFVAGVLMDTLRPAIVGLLERATTSDDHDTAHYAKIGLAMRGRTEFADEVADVLGREPSSSIPIYAFEAAAGLGLSRFCERLHEIYDELDKLQQQGHRSHHFEAWAARKACCNNDHNIDRG